MSYIIVPFTEERFKGLNALKTFDRQKCLLMSPEKGIYYRWLFAKEVIKKCGKNDIVIAWEFEYARNIEIVSKILRKPVKIIGMNFIDHTPVGSFKAKIKSLLYNIIFADTNFYITINCIEYLPEYEKKYKFHRDRILELPDCNFRTDIQYAEFSEGDGSIFCGGYIRDWNTYVKAAKLLPQYKFIAMMKNATDYQGVIPNNMKIYQDVPIVKFYELLKNCSISVIALPSTVPNGFTVMVQSAYLNRPIIATDCIGVNKFLYNEEKGMWGGLTYKMNNAEDLASQISLLYDDIQLRKLLCNTMLENAKKRSAEEYSNTLLKFIDKIIEL